METYHPYATGPHHPVEACFQFVKRMNGNNLGKLYHRPLDGRSCFQFVKRMNGNPEVRRVIDQQLLLPIREAYEWKQLISPCILSALQTCFQFVKRMNGNKPLSISMETISILLPIREAYEWKRFHGQKQTSEKTHLLPIREAYEWKLQGKDRRCWFHLASNS